MTLPPRGEIFDFIIVGAGISGLTLAHGLHSKGFRVLNIEKSKGVGGRLATRRLGDYTFDHGAQFINLSSESLSHWKANLTEAGVLSPWIEKDNQWLYASAGGLTKVAKHLSKDLNVLLNEKVLEVHENPSQIFELICESGQKYLSQRVVLSAPLPQSLEILRKSQISFPEDLASIQYAKAIVGLIQGIADRTEEGSSLRNSAGLVDDPSSNRSIANFFFQEGLSSDVFSLSSQESKGVSVWPAVTMTMTPLWSQDHFEESEEDIALKMKEIFFSEVSPRLPKFKFSKMEVKKWRYSHPLEIFPESFLPLGKNKNIILIGDAFGGGSVSGAMRSAVSFLEKI